MSTSMQNLVSALAYVELMETCGWNESLEENCVSELYDARQHGADIGNLPGRIEQTFIRAQNRDHGVTAEIIAGVKNAINETINRLSQAA